MKPEDRKWYQDRQAAAAKERAKRLAAERERLAKEKAYIDTLPRLAGAANEILVATSMDCARDYAKTVEFGRKNGTGVEFRKKLAELVALGCAVQMPNRTAIEILARDAEFVEFRAYTGPRKGTYAVALSKDVR
jgi:hypothetical protein